MEGWASSQNVAFEGFYPKKKRNFLSSHHISSLFRAPKSNRICARVAANSFKSLSFNQRWEGASAITYRLNAGVCGRTNTRKLVCHRKIFFLLSSLSLFISHPPETGRGRGSHHSKAFFASPTRQQPKKAMATSTKWMTGFRVNRLTEFLFHQQAFLGFVFWCVRKNIFNFCHQAYKSPTGRVRDEEGDLRMERGVRCAGDLDVVGQSALV